MIAIFYVVDIPFSVLALLGWAALMGLELGAIVGVVAVTSVMRWLMIGWALRTLLGPVDRWQAAPDDDRGLVEADAALADMPRRFGLAFPVCWLITYGLVTAWVWFAQPHSAPIGPADLLTSAGFLLGCLTGGASFAFAISNIALVGTRRAMFRAWAERGPCSGRRGAAGARDGTGGGVSLSARLTQTMFLLILAPTSLIGATAWSNEVAFDRYDLVVALGAQADIELELIDAGFPPTRGRIVDEAGLPQATGAGVVQTLPPLRHRVSLDRRAGTATVAAALDDGRWLLIEGTVERAERGFATKLLIFCMVLSIYAVVMALILPRSLIDPLRELEQVLARLVRVGDLHAIDDTPVLEHDELGRVTQCVNDLLAELRELAAAARTVADGRLATEIEHPGELQDAFRAMLEQLRRMVGHIRETAVGVASAASEIHATARAQESVAVQHAHGITGVSTRIVSLATAAEQVTANATEVLDDAEQTLQTTDVALARIAELREQASGIADLLDVIREIADRSDLLALNGSLEATRAGEAGRGFALVAAEMRRLAERVTAVVVDVRARVGEINESGANTVTATARSRELAQHTAEAARRIFAATQKQSEDTGHVSTTMAEMSEFVAAAAATTMQTRSASEELREQIEQLEHVTRQFD